MLGSSVSSHCFLSSPAPIRSYLEDATSLASLSPLLLSTLLLAHVAFDTIAVSPSNPLCVPLSKAVSCIEFQIKGQLSGLEPKIFLSRLNCLDPSLLGFLCRLFLFAPSNPLFSHWYLFFSSLGKAVY